MFTALDTETSKPMVVYMNEAHGTYYVRSLKEFTSNVMEDSEDGGLPRFRRLDDAPSKS